jgi:hypothetical protein
MKQLLRDVRQHRMGVLLFVAVWLGFWAWVVIGARLVGDMDMAAIMVHPALPLVAGFLNRALAVARGRPGRGARHGADRRHGRLPARQRAPARAARIRRPAGPPGGKYARGPDRRVRGRGHAQHRMGGAVRRAIPRFSLRACGAGPTLAGSGLSRQPTPPPRCCVTDQKSAPCRSARSSS